MCQVKKFENAIESGRIVVKFIIADETGQILERLWIQYLSFFNILLTLNFCQKGANFSRSEYRLEEISAKMHRNINA